ncbi:aldo/keto reductase [Aeromicrobium sp. YIM 150415]|uniref:aldo/keto reductase n=1 Tax=Aeromicrobium sp. YIM 150415 TaxID=2803912 RepID=UPI001962834B|nr:aldo/keto reductase [Aeromicrobium sp. YIM 150415]MBM9464047.1 aldo/keto reductase [Aeromicrobium sp. YIM 150415]
MSGVGLGCMGMSFAYGDDTASDDPRVVLGIAAQAGTAERAMMLDTADVYGPFHNEELLGRVLSHVERERVLVASKAGLIATGDGNRTRIDARPEHLREAVDASLQRLRMERIDLHYLHRVDPSVPIEESWGTLAEMATAGKIAALGLSEVGVDELERAQAVHPVAAVQSELSLFRRAQLAEVVPWCERNGLVFVAYAPLGRGWLTGAVSPATRFGEDDFRSRLPMFAPQAILENQSLLAEVRAIAERRRVTAGQVALSWLSAQSPAIVAIPGTRRISRLWENLDSRRLRLDSDELDRLSGVPEPRQPRYAESAR